MLADRVRTEQSVVEGVADCRASWSMRCQFLFSSISHTPNKPRKFSRRFTARGMHRCFGTMLSNGLALFPFGRAIALIENLILTCPIRGATP